MKTPSFLGLVKLADREFFYSFMNKEDVFKELFGQSAQRFDRVRNAMQIVAGDDQINKTLSWINKILGLTYKLPASWFS